MTDIAAVSTKEQQRWAFPQVRRVGSTIYVGLQVPGAELSSIEDQTHHVFKSLVSALESQGGSMSDLTKLHTYYQFEGEGRDVTDYWEQMTAVRLQYLANPGPAATALRIAGLWPAGPLIGADGIGEVGGAKKRIMPDHAWDWSIPTPFSQGWLVGDKKVYVGGQISADRQGKALAAGDVVAQAKNALEYIRHVLMDAGSNWDDVVTLKIAYQHTGDDTESRALLQEIIKQAEELFPNNKPALIPFGVNLLYEGLVLEIDALAVKGSERRALNAPGSQTWKAPEDNFEIAWQVGDEIYLGGISAPGGASLDAQLEASMGRVGETLRAASSDFGDLVKLNIYVSGDAKSAARDMELVAGTLENFLEKGKTVVSIVRVEALPRPGQRVQVDGVAVTNQ
ncbi:RidA family protein [Caballeronia sp. LZ029]|uniref:RidA family protein n=1 Tax=Caballeronia sp. LZ029 TaxID=3038564 RepID=UPI0028617481|nr:RidA family protein [Caballeronia sp. LZ029]MDR5749039.1 RidA family protein [Caballeronia sp. LZ029]